MKELAPEWQSLDLFKILKKKNSTSAVAAIHLLRTCMPEIAEVLRSGGTSSTDFTLHDDRHSYRVACRMVEVIPSDVLKKLSVYEYSLLILSAYLHDIGMTPVKGKVSSHYSYILTGEEGLLGQEESRQLRLWLSDYAQDVTIPLSKAGFRSEHIYLAERLTALYCRFKHNDWSEEWIKANLSKVEWEGYGGWVYDLILLCKSHHFGYSELSKPSYNPKLIGNGNDSIVNMRYLACVLRVADILEFDPERTPEVIFRHREISSDSAIFWHKDHNIQRLISNDKSQVFISAEPPNAKLHKAILEMADSIDVELLLCRRLAEELHFEKFPGLMPDLSHRWDLPYAVHRQIRAKENTYVYIDGAFRPDTKKLLELLSGTQLYQSSLAAIRELLQNAFDAVKEALAYEWLAETARDWTRMQTLAKLHNVHLRVDVTPKSIWLRCSDSGVGMSKSIIENHVLVSGSSRRGDLVELEKRSAEAGLPLHRTGQFGIGLLSYFMIASRVIITTKRNNLCDDTEPNGWEFETAGIGSFGELRKQNVKKQGTVVSLELKDGIANEPMSFYQQLIAYLRTTLKFIPCSFQVSSNLEKDVTRLEPGWVYSNEDLAKQVLAGLPGSTAWQTKNPAMIPKRRIRENEIKKAYWLSIHKEVRDRLRMHTVSGELPGKLGNYRVHIPTFAIGNGVSLAFLRSTEEGRGWYFFHSRRDRIPQLERNEY